MAEAMRIEDQVANALTSLNLIDLDVEMPEDPADFISIKFKARLAADGFDLKPHGMSLGMSRQNFHPIRARDAVVRYLQIVNREIPAEPEKPRGWKDDGGKLRYDLVPSDFLFALVTILTFGAVKYGPRNWEAGMDWSRPFAALHRHTWAWWGGEKCDPETGKSHLWHAACCICFLIVYEMRGLGKDDRPIDGKEDAE